MRSNYNITQEGITAMATKMQKVDWENAQERKAVAAEITQLIEETVIMDDVAGAICDVVNFNEGDTPRFKTRAGLRAYVHTRGTYAPRSKITQRTFPLSTEMVSCHPEVELQQLEAGHYGTVAEITEMARDELLGTKNAIFWTTLINSIASGAANYGSFASGATANTMTAALNTAINYVNNISNVTAIVAQRAAITWLSDQCTTGTLTAANYMRIPDSQVEQVLREGYLGDYRGANVFMLRQYQDAYGINRINASNIMVLGEGTCKMGVTESLRSMDAIDINTLMWHLHLWEKYGFAVIWPLRNYRIEIT